MSTVDYKLMDANPDPAARNAERTAGRILCAAQAVFTAKGFDAAGTREIAERAGVNVALIARYFGSKEGLFEAAVLAHLAPDPGVWGGDDLAETVARLLSEKPAEVEFDPIIAALRSAGSPVVGARLKVAIESGGLAGLARLLDGDAAVTRAGLILALIAGYDVTVRMLKVDIRQAANRVELKARIRAMVEAVLADHPPAD